MAGSQEAQAEQNNSGGLLGKIKKTLLRGLESLQYVNKLAKGCSSLWLSNIHFKTQLKNTFGIDTDMNYKLELDFMPPTV
jgi:hypothetical protein